MTYSEYIDLHAKLLHEIFSTYTPDRINFMQFPLFHEYGQDSNVRERVEQLAKMKLLLPR
jgi:hypothetical protein